MYAAEEVQIHATATNHSSSTSNGHMDVNLMPELCGITKQAAAEKPFEQIPMRKTAS